jgi:acetylcholinesterase
LRQTNITITAQLATYLNTYLLKDATAAEVQGFVNLYPDNPSAGSLFRTSPLNNIYPEFKRLSAIAGDITFNLARRIFLNTSSAVNPTIPSWPYLVSYDYGTPILGTFHASDIPQAYGETPGFSSSTTQSYYLSFINTLDPNNGTTGLPNWLQWSVGGQLMNFNLLF